jgi:hypothetical protein
LGDETDPIGYTINNPDYGISIIKPKLEKIKNNYLQDKNDKLKRKESIVHNISNKKPIGGGKGKKSHHIRLEHKPLSLSPGSKYGGGIVVGLYDPSCSDLFGAPSFGGTRRSSWEDLMLGSTGNTGDNKKYNSELYKSRTDHHGYGFTSKNPCLAPETDMCGKHEDSYYIIIYPNEIAIDGDGNLIDSRKYPGATNDFHWSNKGSSWGPLYSNFGDFNDLDSSYPQGTYGYSEGIWADTIHGETASFNNIPLNTFDLCKNARINGAGPIEKLLSKPLQTAHGLWHRNYGLYNTIRAISADNANFAGYSGGAGNHGYTAGSFGPGITAGLYTAFRSTRLLSDSLGEGVSGPHPYISDWYLPSHDEMSFIAANCIGLYGYDLNDKITQSGGRPITGWHWTSTGSFNETLGVTGENVEGVMDNTFLSPDPGSVAWAMYFPESGIDQNNMKYFTHKKNRFTNKYKARPIRLVRSDLKYPFQGSTGESNNAKLWYIPKTLRDE